MAEGPPGEHDANNEEVLDWPEVLRRPPLLAAGPPHAAASGRE